MLNYTEFGYETGKRTQLSWGFGSEVAKFTIKSDKKIKKNLKSFGGQLFFDFESSWLKDELKKTVFDDDIIDFYRKYAENRNFSHLFFPNVRTYVTDFIGRVLTRDYETNHDGSIRKNCAIKKAQKIVENNDVNALLDMLDSHSRLHSKGEQIAFETLKYQASEVFTNEEEESVEDELVKCKKVQIIVGLRKLYLEGMCEHELKELCATYEVEYCDIAAVRTHVQTTLNVA